MYKATTQTRRSNNYGSYRSYVRPEFKKDYKVELLPYQEGGIICRNLWNSKNHVIRIIPGYDPVTGEIFRQNVKCNEYCNDDYPEEYLSDTFFMCDTVENFGERKQSFVVNYKPGSPDDIKYGTDGSVIAQFISNVYRSVNAKPGRSKFGVSNDMRKWASKDGPLKYAKPAILMQALTFIINDRPSSQKDPNGNYVDLIDDYGEILPLLGVVSVTGKTAVADLLKAFVEPSNPGLPLDAITNNKYGGMAELDGNKLFLNTYTDPKTRYSELRPSVQGATKGWTPTPYPLQPEEVYSLWTPWSELIDFMTAEQQCQLLAAEFGADAVNYLIGTDPMFKTLEIPKEIAAQGLGQYQRFIDGGVGQTITIQQRPQTPAAGYTGYSAPNPTGRDEGSYPNPLRRDEGAYQARPGDPGNPTMTGIPRRGLSGAMPTRPQPAAAMQDAPAESPAAPRKNPLSSVQGNMIDRTKLAASVSSIRKAAGTSAIVDNNATIDEQADAAAAILNDETDYGDIPEEYGEQE